MTTIFLSVLIILLLLCVLEMLIRINRKLNPPDFTKEDQTVLRTTEDVREAQGRVPQVKQNKKKE